MSTPEDPIISRADIIMDGLLDLMVSEHITWGANLSEEKIVQALELSGSRTPTREAILHLGAVGLLIRKPKVGSRLVSTELQELQELIPLARQVGVSGVVALGNEETRDTAKSKLIGAADVVKSEAGSFEVGNLRNQDRFLKAESGVHIALSEITEQNVGRRILKLWEHKRRIFRVTHPFISTASVEIMAEANEELVRGILGDGDANARIKAVDECFKVIRAVEMGAEDGLEAAMRALGMPHDSTSVKSRLLTMLAESDNP